MGRRQRNFLKKLRERKNLPNFSVTEGSCSFIDPTGSKSLTAIRAHFSIPLTAQFHPNSAKVWFWQKQTGYSYPNNPNVSVDPYRCYEVSSSFTQYLFGTKMSITLSAVGLGLGLYGARQMFGLNNESRWMDVKYSRATGDVDKDLNQIRFNHIDLKKK